MTDEPETDAREKLAKTAADQTLTLFAVSGDVQRGAMLGAILACGAANRQITPRQFLDELRDEMPDDATWEADRMGDRTRLKIRNQSRWYRAAQIQFIGKGNQG